MKTLISVVIPSYNRANTVGQTIESIVSQKVNANIEIVIGDDCSTDNAREVLLEYKEKYPDIIRLFFWDENMGLGANWASCVKECCGKYICNCDNDDYWHNPNKLQLQLDYMETHPMSNILITNHRTHNRTTGEILEHHRRNNDNTSIKANTDSTDRNILILPFQQAHSNVRATGGCAGQECQPQTQAADRAAVEGRKQWVFRCHRQECKQIDKHGAKAHADQRADKEFLADLEAADNEQRRIHQRNKDTHRTKAQHPVQYHCQAGQTAGIQMVRPKEHVEADGKQSGTGKYPQKPKGSLHCFFHKNFLTLQN